MLNEDAFKQVLGTGATIYLPCYDKSHQESTRVTLQHMKKRLLPGHALDTIGISKYEEDGKLFIKLYPRRHEEFYVMGESGKLVPMELEDPELTHTLASMRKDGLSEEAIEEYKKNYK